MKPTHGQCDQYMAEGQPCSGYRRLEADLAAARAELAAEEQRVADMMADVNRVGHANDALRQDLAAAKRWHEQSSEQWRVAVGEAVQRAERAEADLATAQALLGEARESWIKVGYGASHEDVAECNDFCKRIDAALAGETRNEL